MTPVVPGAAQVGVLPDAGAGACDAGRAALRHPGIGEGGRKGRTSEVGDQPLLVSGAAGKHVDRDLQRGRQAHHPAPGWTNLVEHPLHGQVARRPEPQRNIRAGVVGVEPDGLQPDPLRRSDRCGAPQYTGRGHGQGPRRSAGAPGTARSGHRARRTGPPPGRNRHRTRLPGPPGEPGAAVRLRSPGSARLQPPLVPAADPGRTTAAQPCSCPCRQARLRPPSWHQCWYRTAVLNLYRSWGRQY